MTDCFKCVKLFFVLYERIDLILKLQDKLKKQKELRKKILSLALSGTLTASLASCDFNQKNQTEGIYAKDNHYVVVNQKSLQEKYYYVFPTVKTINNHELIMVDKEPTILEKLKDKFDKSENYYGIGYVDPDTLEEVIKPGCKKIIAKKINGDSVFEITYFTSSSVDYLYTDTLKPYTKEIKEIEEPVVNFDLENCTYLSPEKQSLNGHIYLEGTVLKNGTKADFIYDVTEQRMLISDANIISDEYISKTGQIYRNVFRGNSVIDYKDEIYSVSEDRVILFAEQIGDEELSFTKDVLIKFNSGYFNNINPGIYNLSKEKVEIPEGIFQSISDEYLNEQGEICRKLSINTDRNKKEPETWILNISKGVIIPEKNKSENFPSIITKSQPLSFEIMKNNLELSLINAPYYIFTDTKWQNAQGDLCVLYSSSKEFIGTKKGILNLSKKEVEVPEGVFSNISNEEYQINFKRYIDLALSSVSQYNLMFVTYNITDGTIVLEKPNLKEKQLIKTK